MVEYDSKYYSNSFSHLLNLPTFAVMPTGRTGSDYLQSLLEGHPEILTFNSHFAWYGQFYNCARSVLVENQNPTDVVNEFVGLFIYKLVSRYDLQEGKDRLGINRNESISIDLDEFRHHVLCLIRDQQLTSRNWLLAIYGGWSLCLNRDILQTKVFLHHPHLESELRQFISEFPKSEVIFTLRDIRASLLSQVFNFREYYPNIHDNQGHFYESLRMNLESNNVVSGLSVRSINVRLEDLPRAEILGSLCNRLGIGWNQCVLKSTWAGLEWNGDRLSKNVPDKTWSSTRTYNDWKNRLSRRDRALLRACSGRRLVDLRYEVKESKKVVKYLMFLNAVFPMSLEMRYLTPTYIVKRLKLKRVGLIQVIESPFFYLKRVKLCWSYLSMSVRGQIVELEWIDTV